MMRENRISRLAGLLYLIVVVTGIFSLAYVPSKITVANNLPATVQNIIESESLFRLGIASFLIEQVAFLLLPIVLFRLLRTVHRSMAVLMVTLAVVSIPIALVSVSHRLDVLSLLTRASLDQAPIPEHVLDAVRRALDSYSNGLLVTSLFWGLWLFPFGYLVLKSGFLPKLLGLLLMLGCLGYMTDVFGALLVPHYSDLPISNYMLLPAAAGEIGTCLWLLLVGVRHPASSQPGKPSKRVHAPHTTVLHLGDVPPNTGDPSLRA